MGLRIGGGSKACGRLQVSGVVDFGGGLGGGGRARTFAAGEIRADNRGEALAVGGEGEPPGPEIMRFVPPDFAAARDIMPEEGGPSKPVMIRVRPLGRRMQPEAKLPTGGGRSAGCVLTFCDCQRLEI